MFICLSQIQKSLFTKKPPIKGGFKQCTFTALFNNKVLYCHQYWQLTLKL